MSVPFPLHAMLRIDREIFPQAVVPFSNSVLTKKIRRKISFRSSRNGKKICRYRSSVGGPGRLDPRRVPGRPIPEIKGRHQDVARAPSFQRGRRAALEVIVFVVPKSLYFAGAATRRVQTINSADIRRALSLHPCAAAGNSSV